MEELFFSVQIVLFVRIRVLNGRIAPVPMGQMAGKLFFDRAEIPMTKIAGQIGNAKTSPPKYFP